MDSRYASGLLVVQDGARAEREIDAELKQLDGELFLDREWDTSRDCAFYTVRYRVGFGSELILDWRDPDDTPRPLSSGIVSEVARMMAQGPIDYAALTKRNRELQEAKRLRSEQAYRDLAADFERYESPIHSPVLHRGQHLRRSRDRQRAAGRRV